MIRKERPLCRRAIEKFGLRPTTSPAVAAKPDGTRTVLSAGLRTQMRKMREEGYWSPDDVVEAFPRETRPRRETE